MGFQITRGVQVKPQKVVVYGVEGVGKTMLASQFPSPLFIDTEGGTSHMDVNRLPQPTSWRMLLDEVTWVRDFPAECGGTLVIDTADWAEKLCIAHVCGEHKWAGVEDAGYGKGYTYVTEEFGKLLNLLGEVIERGLNVVVTAHAVITKFEQPDEMGAYDRWGLKLIDGKKASCSAMLREWADAVLFADYKTMVVATEKDGKKHKAQGGKNRVLHTTHAAAWDAKNRWGLPDEVPMEFAQIAPYIPVPSFAAPTPTPAQSPGASTPMGVTEEELQAAREMPVPFDTVRPGHLKPLYDLMARDGVSEVQLQAAMAKKGYFTADTPISVYDEQAAGWVVSVWDQIREFINSGMPEK